MAEELPIKRPEDSPPEILDPSITNELSTKQVDDPTDYTNTKAMMIYLFNKLGKLKEKRKYTDADYMVLFKITAKKFNFKSDQVLLVLLSRAAAFYCSEYRKQLGFAKKQLLMQFVMIIQKVLNDRKWMKFDEDGNYSSYIRFCAVLHTKPRRFARYLYDALEESIKHAAD